MSDPPSESLPIRAHHLGEPIPDLTQISEDRWLEVVTPLSRDGRQLAMDLAKSHGADLVAVTDLLLALPRVAALGQSAALHAGAPADIHGFELPPPQPRRRARKQVAFRITDAEHGELRDAAAELGLKPMQLARMLVHNGVRRVLYEARQRRGS